MKVRLLKKARTERDWWSVEDEIDSIMGVIIRDYRLDFARKYKRNHWYLKWRNRK